MRTIELQLQHCLRKSILAVLLLPALGGCASLKMQAPFDSFVCFDKSLQACVEGVEDGRLIGLNRLNMEWKGSDDYLWNDPDADKVAQSSDKKYECRSGAVPYSQSLQPQADASVVFVSPVLFKQIGEQRLWLKRARDKCNALVGEYEHQLLLLGLQNQLSKSQQAIAVLEAEIASERSAKDGFGARGLTPEEAGKFELAGPVRDASRQARVNAVATSESIREEVRKQVFEQEYLRRFEEANFSIGVQLRDLARSLFLLDRATVDGVALSKTLYSGGSWIEKGTVIAEMKP